MCGISGILTTSMSSIETRKAVSLMQNKLKHRGPDDEGLWLSPSQQCTLAHRRLAIIDLSSAGRQPISTLDGRYTIVFNGEIYNFRSLKKDLQIAGVHFQSDSDTEVILRLFEKHGKSCVSMLRGMFAFVIWDEFNRSAFIARDPFGIKPLYLFRSETTLAFSSELQSLIEGNLFKPSINPEAVKNYFITGSVQEPNTIVKQVTMLGAGETLSWSAGASNIQTYWQISFTTDTSEGNASDRTRAALLDSMQHHMVSDVPVGLFLSGGIDSTAILALCSLLGHNEMATFCIAVDDPAADESNVARRTASHFGADYHEMLLTASTARELFAAYINCLDQPSIDGLNTFTVSALARKHGVKVVLSGLGGDEFFGGYSSFRKIPLMLRLHSLLNKVPGALNLSTKILSKKSKGKRLIDFLNSEGSLNHAYSSLRGLFSISESKTLTSWICGDHAGPELPEVYPAFLEAGDNLSYLEVTRYMRNQLLRDSDVMSMANGLELRVPFVDSTLFDNISGIPSKERLAAGKKLLTTALPEIPEWVVRQKKRGFLFPYQKWLASEWSKTFDEATQKSPIPLPNWYQKWAVYTLRTCCKKLKIPLL